jgi:hypothetical protein
VKGIKIKKESLSIFMVTRNPNWFSEILDKKASYTKQNIKIILKVSYLKEVALIVV